MNLRGSPSAPACHVRPSAEAGPPPPPCTPAAAHEMRSRWGLLCQQQNPNIRFSLAPRKQHCPNHSTVDQNDALAVTGVMRWLLDFHLLMQGAVPVQIHWRVLSVRVLICAVVYWCRSAFARRSSTHFSGAGGTLPCKRQRHKPNPIPRTTS